MADAKLTELTADATPTSDDITYVVDAPGGAATSKKVTLANLGKGIDHSVLLNLTSGDPHTQYRLEADDHTHQSTGAQAGQLDHGLALTGLTDDDHAQYLLASQATDRNTFTTNWTDLTDGGQTSLHTHAGSSVDYSTLTGKPTDLDLDDAASTAEKFSDHIFPGTNISLTELADGSGDAVKIDGSTTPTITDFSNATHTHQSSAQAGQLDHGLALTGLADDDHSAYLLASDAGGRSTFATNWTDLTDGGQTTLHTHAGGATQETDQALYDAASTAEKFSEHVFAGTNITITELADGDAVSIAATGGGSTTFSPPGLRLTLTSGVPVTTSDVTSAGTLYWTPYLSGSVTYWDGAAWQQEYITEQSLALTLTSGKNYDVFYLHGTGLVLSNAWTNDTTRADALGTQNGVTVLSSDHTKLWIGTIRASGTNVTEDSGGGTTTQVGGKRFVYNTFNQVPRFASIIDTTDSWTYASATIRQANGASGNQVEAVFGASQMVVASLVVNAYLSTANIESVAGIGIDSTTVYSGLRGDTYTNGSATVNNIASRLAGYSGLGYHRYTWLESSPQGTSTFLGDNGGTQIQSGLILHLTN